MNGETARDGRRDRVVSSLIGLASAFYLFLFWSLRVTWTPAWFRWLQDGIRHTAEVALTALVEALGGRGLPVGWRWAGTSVVMGVIFPWLLMALIGRGQPRDIGLRRPNRVAWRVIPIAYVLALPMLFVMARSPGTRAWYNQQLAGRTVAGLLGTYLVVVVAEHFMFQGILLALLAPGRRWPVIGEPAPVEGPFWQRALRFFGLAQPTSGERGLAGALRWLGVPERCLGAMVFQAVLFGICHVGKAPAEVLLSFPGGLALAYVAYRGNSLLVPLMVHVATGLTALAFVWMLA